VSCTVTFDPTTEGPQLEKALNLYQYQLKGVSFLPRTRAAAAATPYPQMPYEAISSAQYEDAIKNIRPLDLQYMDGGLSPTSVVEEVPDKFCDAAGCSVGIGDHV
ncbi:rtpR, partial [Symbiodinium microadriaticum]